MPVRLDRNSADFDQRFAAFLAAKREVSADVEAAARAIVQDVAVRGDAALIEATRKFDRLTLDASGLRVSAAEIDAALEACDSPTLDALTFARDRIKSFHLKQLPKDERFTDASGVELGWLIDADTETVYIYRHDRPIEKKKGPRKLAGEGPVNGFVLELKPVWKGF